MSETAIQARIMLAIGAQPRVRVFRNTVGEGWVGEVARREGEFVVLRNARRVTFGLCPGSPDIVGWRSVLITPDMIGERLAQFVGLEVKTRTGRTSAEQDRFIPTLQEAGACAGVIRSPDEALAMVMVGGAA